jgi:hypothetical protein
MDTRIVGCLGAVFWTLPMVTLFGCIQASDPPLGEDGGAAIDADLLGVWGDKKGHSDKWFLIQMKPGSETMLQAVWPEDDTYIDLSAFKIGGYGYASATYSDMPERTYIFPYEFHGKDDVSIYILDREVIYDAIGNRELAGTTWWLSGHQSQITETPARLRAYLESHGVHCFHRQPIARLKRIKSG